ncbi:MAG: hypothetical protein WBC18_06235 [Ottowia sp.]|uniref:hypothetical protein n=1 Tax=unclassified Ottowia TaxID=2645081 RepID=UPI003C2B7A60
MSSSTDTSSPRPLSAPGKAVEPGGLGPISELEKALAGPKEEAQAAIEAADARLASLAQRTKQAIAAGSDPAGFARLRAVAKACETAREILGKAASSGGHGARMR